MKQIFLLFVSLLILSAVFAVTPSYKSPIKASQVRIYISKENTISLLELAIMSRSEFEALRGKRLNIWERVHFRLAQNKLRNDINSNGELIGKKYERLSAPDPGMNGTTGFHLGGAALGFFLGLIGVLIAYLLKDEKKRNRVKWAWIGFAVALVLGLGFAFLL